MPLVCTRNPYSTWGYIIDVERDNLPDTVDTTDNGMHCAHNERVGKSFSTKGPLETETRDEDQKTI